MIDRIQLFPYRKLSAFNNIRDTLRSLIGGTEYVEEFSENERYTWGKFINQNRIIIFLI